MSVSVTSHQVVLVPRWGQPKGFVQPGRKGGFVVGMGLVCLPGGLVTACHCCFLFLFLLDIVLLDVQYCCGRPISIPVQVVRGGKCFGSDGCRLVGIERSLVSVLQYVRSALGWLVVSKTLVLCWEGGH